MICVVVPGDTNGCDRLAITIQNWGANAPQSDSCLLIVNCVTELAHEIQCSFSFFGETIVFSLWRKSPALIIWSSSDSGKYANNALPRPVQCNGKR